MDCEKYEMMIGSLIDGNLDPRACRELLAHTGTCTACQTYMWRLVKIRNAASESWEIRSRAPEAIPRAGRSGPAAPDAPGLRAGRSRTGLLRRQIRVSVPAALIAAVMIAVWTLAITVTFITSGRNSTPDPSRIYPPSAMQPISARNGANP